MIKFGTIVAAVLGIVALIVVIALVLSIPLWLLWNWLMPVVFPEGGIVHHITWLQALGIMLLSSILFKSSGSSSSSKS